MLAASISTQLAAPVVDITRMDGTTFDRGSLGDAQQWVEPWRAEAPKRLTREQLRLVESVRLPLHDLAKLVAYRGGSSEVDDLHQIAMEHALRLLPEYEPRRGARFLTFVFLRVRLVMQRSLKAEKRDHAHAGATDRLGYDSDPESPEERLGIEEERALRQRAIERALLRLDDTANALVRACFWEDLSVAEAARRLGLGYEDARYRLKVALGRIGQMLRAGPHAQREGRV